MISGAITSIGWVAPSATTTIVFVAICLGLVALFVRAASNGPNGEPPDQTRRWVLGTAAFAAIYLLVTVLPAAMGAFQPNQSPPLVVPFLIVCLLVSVVLSMSRVGARVANHIPIYALVGFQAFRLPLELILHAWYNQGVLPVQMTFSGHNFDIVTGILALVLGGWAYFRSVPKALIFGFNLIGSVLLLIVIAIAVTSTPVPIRQYWNEPAVLLAFHAPYVWIVPVCVGGALFGHIVLFRRLKKPATRP